MKFFVIAVPLAFAAVMLGLLIASVLAQLTGVFRW